MTFKKELNIAWTKIYILRTLKAAVTLSNSCLEETGKFDMGYYLLSYK